jgi:predicted ArsR family transcriptional regulator
MEFSTEFWANHKKGIEKRAEISNYLSKNPTASVELIAVAVNLSTRQVRRHLNTIRVEKSASSIAIASTFLICSLGQTGNW